MLDSTNSDHIEVTIDTSMLYEEILACTSVGLVPNIAGSPGIGKSAAHREFAKDYCLKLIDCRLSTYTPEDLNGFPTKLNNNRAGFIPFETFPLEDDPLPLDENGEELDGWFIFFDEITSANKMVQAAAYRIILDREVAGGRKLHPCVLMSAAGNLETDKAVVNTMSTALRNRMVNYTLKPSLRHFTKIASAKEFDMRVISYLNWKPQDLMSFKPNMVDLNFASPRTWEFASRLIQGTKDVDEKILPRLAGCLGSGVATEFITFCKQFADLPSFKEVLSDPEGVSLPTNIASKWAITGMLAHNTTPDNVETVLKCVDRFDHIEHRILYLRSTAARLPALETENEAFCKASYIMAAYLS